MSGSALGWFLGMLVNALFQKSGWIGKLIAFLVGNGVFQALIWSLNAKVNASCTDNEIVIVKTFSVVFGVSAVALLAAFIIRATKKYKVLNIILAADQNRSADLRAYNLSCRLQDINTERFRKTDTLRCYFCLLNHACDKLIHAVSPPVQMSFISKEKICYGIIVADLDIKLKEFFNLFSLCIVYFILPAGQAD
jgi:hypothetical protein